MIPIQRFGLAIMSIGFLVEEDTAMIWRGPMVMSAITQMLRDVAWGTLDILVVDMPPGTGDAQLTLAQNVPLKGAVIISTPQDLSLIDARRGLAMFRKVNVPVLGIVENMSYFQCPHCGTRSDIFGHGGARHEAERLGVPFLGEIPLHMSIRTTSDAGTPVVASEPDGPHAAIYRAIGSKVREQLQGAIARPPRPGHWTRPPALYDFRLISAAMPVVSLFAYSRATSMLKPPRQSAPDDVDSPRRRNARGNTGNAPQGEFE